MEITVSKKDVLSGYIAQLFNYGSGLIILPVILNKLSAEEIGLNYIMLTVGALTNIADFGFSGQIGRNITYVLSGANKIYKGEIEYVNEGNKINYKLLKTIIDASKYLYSLISLAVLLILLTLGSLYMYFVTDGFSNVNNSLIIWVTFCAGIYFNLYFLYYNSFLTGAALIKEQRIATILSRIAYIAICFIMIYCGFGLVSIVIANLIAPFIARYYSHIKFYTEEIKENLPKEKSSKNEVLDAISKIWYTAKKGGTNAIGHYIGTNGGMFIAGIYLPLAVTAQWGVMTQLFGVAQGVAMNIGLSYYPEYCKLRLRNDKPNIIKKSSFAFASMFIILLVVGIAIIIGGQYALDVIKSKTSLPSVLLMSYYLLYLIILCNAQLFAMLMTSRNIIPSPLAVLITSFSQIALTIIFLHFFHIGIWALLFGPLLSGLSYTYWAWMILELRDMKCGVVAFYKTGFKELTKQVKRIIIK